MAGCAPDTGVANPPTPAAAAAHGAVKPKKKRIRVYPKQSSYCKFKLVDAEKRAVALLQEADKLRAENELLRHKHEHLQVRGDARAFARWCRVMLDSCCSHAWYPMHEVMHTLSPAVLVLRLCAAGQASVP